MTKCKTCGHDEMLHIYGEGACRPGFICGSGCTKFVPAVTINPTQREFINSLDNIVAALSDCCDKVSTAKKLRYKSIHDDQLCGVYAILRGVMDIVEGVPV